jgi:hypothetical protein
MPTKIRGFAVSLALAIAVLPVRAALAVPEPLPEERLRAMADAIVVVDVASVTNIGLRKFDGATLYEAVLVVRDVEKGSYPRGRIMCWQFDSHGPPLGGSGGFSFAGERYRLYLERHPDGTYDTWRYDCVHTLVRLPEDREVLPQATGQTIYAPGWYAGTCCRPRCRWLRFR